MRLARRSRWWLAAVMVAASAVILWAATAENWPADAEVARTSGRSLTLAFRVSYGANLFYVVDQVSRWDAATHPYYRDYWERRFGFSEEDRQVLDKYRAVRAQYPWGVLEPAFLGAGDGRAAWGRLERIASRRDAQAVWQALRHFRPGFDQVWRESAYLPEMTVELAADMTEQRKRLLDEAAGFLGSPRLTLDVFAVWSPEPRAGGGGYNGGRIALEMPRGRPLDRVMAVLYHEAFHAFQQPREQVLQAFGAKHGIPSGVMHEAIIYSIAPGVFERRYGHQDPLPQQIAEMEQAEVSPEDELLQIRKLALALEPVTDECLRTERALAEYLPEVAETWKRLLATDAYLRQLKELEARPAGSGMMLELREGRLLVAALTPGSPAEKAGIRVGDEIVQVRGKTLSEWQRGGVSAGRVGWLQLRGRQGEMVEAAVRRGEQLLYLEVRLEVAPPTTAPPQSREFRVAAICRREVAEALSSRLQLALQAFSPEFIPRYLEATRHLPLIIAISPDEIGIPKRYHYLVPMDYDQVMAQLHRGQAVAVEKEMRGRLVLLLAAPDRDRLLELIRTRDFSRLLAAVAKEPAAR